MWRVIDDLLGRVNNTAFSTSFTADDFSKFFSDKSIDVRSFTCGALAPFITAGPPRCRLDCFSCVSDLDLLEVYRVAADQTM